MFENFFRLRENPFNVNVDPRFFFPTPQTEEALQNVAYGIQNRKGLILLTGDVGTGKTMLITQLLNWLRQLRTPTAFVFNSRNLGEGDLSTLMAYDFGVATQPMDRTNLPIRLNSWFLECYRVGVSPVLIVDEAQGLSFERLEEIRLLLNVETPSEKMLQIVFAGQPELENNLNQPEGCQLRQRIAVRCKISPLTMEQTHGYIEQRLRIAGGDGDPIFARRRWGSLLRAWIPIQPDLRRC
jgi:general secretion pathway protein A